MAERQTFYELYDHLIRKLIIEGKILNVTTHFLPFVDVKDMFSFFWSLDEAHQILTPTLIKEGKSDDKAEKLRNEGNICYRKKLLGNALKLYNQSIMFASHPKIKIEKFQNENPDVPNSANQEDSDYDSIHVDSCTNGNEGNYKSLALSYANRAAVLLELGQYNKCIDDIDNALLHGYPRILHSKLAERKAKCLIALQRVNEAKCVLEASLEALDNLPLERDKKKMSRSSLESLLHDCQYLDQEKLSSNLRDSHRHKDKIIFSFETPNPPQLDNHNVNIPSLSSSVDVAFSLHRGRHLVANKDIKPGDLLAVEDPYCQTVYLDSSHLTHCTHCLRRCPTPLPCPNCSQVIFCSRVCRMEALSSFHGPECGILASLAALDISKCSVLACRILSKITFSGLKELVPQYLAESVEKSPGSLGFDSSGRYISSDYRTIYHLLTNNKYRSPSDLFKRCVMAFVLVKLLEQNSKFFVDDAGVSFSPSEADMVLTGSTLCLHMMSLPSNTYAITELKVNTNNYQQSILSDIGCGVFGALSLVNHSCNPVASLFNFGGTKVLRGVRFVPSGTEITVNYGMHYCMNSYIERNMVLSEQFHFLCTCEACRQCWPTYFGLPKECKLKCPKCNNSFDSCGGKCRSLGHTKTSKNETLSVLYNQKELLTQLRSILMNFCRAYASVSAGKTSPDNIRTICTFIEFVDRYVQKPCQLYADAQEALKFCFDSQGSFFIGT